MKKTRLQETRKLKDSQIKKRIAQSEKNLSHASLKLKRGELKNTKELKNSRKEIAQLKTILTENSRLKGTK